MIEDHLSGSAILLLVTLVAGRCSKESLSLVVSDSRSVIVCMEVSTFYIFVPGIILAVGE